MVKDILGISGTTTETNNNNNTAADTTKPVITFPIEPTVGPTSVSINWTTDELSSTQVEYGTTDAYGKSEPPQPADDPTSGTSLGVVTHPVVLSGLQPNTTYHYKVKSKDKAGNEAVSPDKTLTTISAE
jgi:phosphodiesterase/alkaline phosphatase D-like protein